MTASTSYFPLAVPVFQTDPFLIILFIYLLHFLTLFFSLKGPKAGTEIVFKKNHSYKQWYFALKIRKH